MNIIVKNKGTEKERMSTEAKRQTLRHYYGREIRDGSRFKIKCGASKEAIKKVLQ